jgi:hypothetical protein
MELGLPILSAVLDIGCVSRGEGHDNDRTQEPDKDVGELHGGDVIE